jgi:hypothetical protein
MEQLPINNFAKGLILIGVIILVIGVVLLFAGKIPFLGKLPGDFSFKRGNLSVYFPVVTCVVLSILLTLIFNLFFRK